MRGPEARPRFGLSLRLLALTLVFVLLAEALVFLPAIGRARVVYLEQRLAEAHLALLALEATEDGMVDGDLQRRLLGHAGAVAMTAYQSGFFRLRLGPDMPPRVDAAYDLREVGLWPPVGDALMVLTRSQPRLIRVAGISPKDPRVAVEVTLPEAPLRRDLMRFARRLLGLSLIVSLIAGAVVYFSLARLLLKPLSRLVAAMRRFEAAPEDPGRLHTPSTARHEVGEAERTLARMQARVREGLIEHARLAGVGAAVARINHDLKGILTTARLESDRLEAQTRDRDPDLARTTEGIAQALDRAVALCAATLSYAGSELPSARPRRLAAHHELTLAAQRLHQAHPEIAVNLDCAVDTTLSADPDLLARSLDNLTHNAAQAGARHLTLAAHTSNHQTTLTIADDGPGLPQRARDNLFQPFAGSARNGGTGLGLPIARELTQAMNGHLNLHQTTPSGTTFHLTLPT
ncbi:sensor histidine kinase [Roseospirillum parvum]|uniref:histidine kinase n=1 Tax=Roseospirillum parvum TaxID=83401 RepID=A0A1G7WPH0_9PROT|nr:HAMP domain-containing sensor histidine kinase [Roseospirillum parvum]SDG73829.1 Signal transduction histidine kinase [Roseospirillum parvum]